MLNFGRFKHILVFLNSYETKNEFNEVTISYGEVTKVRARVLDKSTTTTEDDTPVSIKLIEITCRFNSALNETQLVRYNNELFEILSVVDFDGSRKALKVTAKRYLND